MIIGKIFYNGLHQQKAKKNNYSDKVAENCKDE